MWALKYAPQNCSDFVCNTSHVTMMKDIFAGNPYSTVIVTGPPGIGKTAAVSVVMKEVGIDPRFYDSVTYKNDKIIHEFVNINNHSILSLLVGKTVVARKTGLVIDNMDSISLSNEKNIILDTIRFNMKHKRFPLVVIVNSVDGKVIEEFRDSVPVFRFDPVTSQAMCKIVDEIARKEKLTLPKTVGKQLVAESQGDIRVMINSLEQLSMCFKGKISHEDFIRYISTFTKRKNKDLTLFDTYKVMVVSYMDIASVISLYNNEKVLLPLIVHENYYKDLFERRLPYAERTRAIESISEYISMSDIIETDIYTDQSWRLQNMHCFISCIKPLWIMNQKKQLTSVNYGISFSSELNKTSLKNINRKNITNISAVTSFTVGDIIGASHVINEVLKKDDYGRIREMMSQYTAKTSDCGGSTKLVEMLLKIDKCNPSVYAMTSKIKKLV